MKREITWPVYSASGKTLLKDGTIDGIPMKEIWKQCQKETREWFKYKLKTDENFKKMMTND